MGHPAPVELVLIEFPRQDFTGTIVDEIARLQDGGTIRVIDALLVRRAPDGTVAWTEAADDDGGLAALVGEPAGLLADDDVDAIAQELPPGSAVGMLLFEHTWAATLTGAITDAGGRLIDSQRIPAEALDEVSALVGEEG